MVAWEGSSSRVSDYTSEWVGIDLECRCGANGQNYYDYNDYKARIAI